MIAQRDNYYDPIRKKNIDQVWIEGIYRPFNLAHGATVERLIEVVGKMAFETICGNTGKKVDTNSLDIIS